MIMTKLTTIITMVVKVMIMKMMMAVRIVVVMVIQVVEVKMRMTMILRCPIMRQNLDLGASYYIQLFVRTRGHLATFISVHFST